MGVRSDIQPLILNIDIADPNAADLFKAAGAGNNKGQFRNVVSEHVLSTLQEAEIVPFLASCDALLATGQSNVFHLVAANDGISNWFDSNIRDPNIVPSRKFLADWTAYNPSHIWIDTVSGQVAGGQ